MVSSRVRANNRRREREQRYEGAAALAARTTHLVDATGRHVHVIDWSPEDIAKWKREQGLLPKPPEPEPEPDMPRRRFLGPSEVWRDDSTGTYDFYLFFIRVWRKDFTHSTGVFE